MSDLANEWYIPTYSTLEMALLTIDSVLPITKEAWTWPKSSEEIPMLTPWQVVCEFLGWE